MVTPSSLGTIFKPFSYSRNGSKSHRGRRRSRCRALPASAMINMSIHNYDTYMNLSYFLEFRAYDICYEYVDCTLLSPTVKGIKCILDALPTVPTPCPIPGTGTGGNVGRILPTTQEHCPLLQQSLDYDTAGVCLLLSCIESPWSSLQEPATSKGLLISSTG